MLDKNNKRNKLLNDSSKIDLSLMYHLKKRAKANKRKLNKSLFNLALLSSILTLGVLILLRHFFLFK
tara:strand:+ start:1351 stop:1551 length:201 start_codon:yes stop_codon:yes gene_type:complete